MTNCLILQHDRRWRCRCLHSMAADCMVKITGFLARKGESLDSLKKRAYWNVKCSVNAKKECNSASKQPKKDCCNRKPGKKRKKSQMLSL